MFKLASPEALIQAFRPKDHDKLELPPDVTFPLAVPSYLAWPHPAGGRVFLLFAVPGGAPTGIVFDTNGAGTSAPQMCSWCHSTGSGSQIGLLTAQVDARRRAGVNICTDLGCERKLEEEAGRGGYSAVFSIERLIARIGRFASEALKMDLTGARR